MQNLGTYITHEHMHAHAYAHPHVHKEPCHPLTLLSTFRGGVTCTRPYIPAQNCLPAPLRCLPFSFTVNPLP